MRILWLVNTIFPYPAEKLGINKTVFGGWLNSLAEELVANKDVNLAICSINKGDKLEIFDDGNIKYYVIPEKMPIEYNKKLEEYFKEIEADFKPDVVHIHGTEYSQGLAYINSCTNKNVVISIQGMVSVLADLYTADINYFEILKNITFRDIVRGTILRDKKIFKQRGKYEIEMLKKSNNVIGRTSWDYSITKKINKDIKYYFCNESLRQDFYSDVWTSYQIEKNTIFVSQGTYPIKGLHYMLKALKILKVKYPNVLLKIAGGNITKSDTFKEKIRMSGYGKYIRRLIKENNLDNNVKFLGVLDSASMKNEMLKSNVFVSPSVLENSSNSLGEAMLLGIPCVASDVGGTCDMLENNKEGYLYNYTEYEILSEYISRIFENDEEAKQFGKVARETAIKRHDRKENAKQMLEIYKQITNNTKEK